MKNIYILRKALDKRIKRLRMVGTVLCRFAIVGAGLLGFIALGGEGPLMIGRRLAMLACAAAVIFIAVKIEERIYMELPLDKYFEE